LQAFPTAISGSVCLGNLLANAHYCHSAFACRTPGLYCTTLSHRKPPCTTLTHGESIFLFKLKCLFNGFAFHFTGPRHMSAVCLRRRRIFGQGLRKKGRNPKNWEKIEEKEVGKSFAD